MSLSDKKLYIFSSNRRLVEFYKKYQDDFAPKAMTIGSFFDFCLSVDQKSKIPATARKILLLQTLREFKNLERFLVFDVTFLAYLETTEFLEQFFDELLVSGCKISDIPLRDIYGDYSDHLKVLEQVYDEYYKKLSERGWFSSVYGEDYQIQQEILEPFDCIEVYLDGILNPIEQKILKQISQFKEVILHFHIDSYNQKFFHFLECDLEEKFAYEVSLGQRKILRQTQDKNLSTINSFNFEMRIDQVSFVIQKAMEWLEQKKERVAIILPDESFALMLRTLDLYDNFNYAMGLDIKTSDYYKVLTEKLEEKKKEELSLDELREILDQVLSQHYLKEIDSFNQRFFLTLQNFDKNDLLKHRIFIAELYLQELEKLRINDTRGGKISVYGILETRGMSFDEIVIVDFNEENLFDLKDNDLFLNTQIRNALQMPTIQDKQNLKRHYYYQLLKNTHKTYITSWQEETENYFLESLGVVKQDFRKTIFDFNIPQITKKEEKEFIGEISKDFIFSSSSLSSFLKCKRQFYFSYIIQLKAPNEDSFVLGSVFHELLKNAYDFGKNDIKEVRNKFEECFDEYPFDTSVNQFEALAKKKLMMDFWKQEKEIFDSPDYRFVQAEKSFEANLFGRVFRGRIDRIDEDKNGFLILDYKTSKNVKIAKLNEELTDFQLPIYQLALEGENKQVKGCYLIGLFSGQRLLDQDILDKIAFLEEIIKTRLDGEIVFEKTPHKKHCINCDYKLLCDRD